MNLRVALVMVWLLASSPSKADLFGGDVAVLTQILANAMQQLSQLQNVVANGQSNLELIRQINQGINDSLSNLRILYPNLDPGLYKEWQTVQGAIQQVEQIYGSIPASREARVQQDTDRSVAEAITFNNSYYEYSKQLDQIGEQIKTQSHVVSPGGAEKLTAQSMGLMLQVLNQILRAQATSMKLQAQNLALENKREKENTKHYLDAAQEFSNTMKRESVDFKAPRF